MESALRRRWTKATTERLCNHNCVRLVVLLHQQKEDCLELWFFLTFVMGLTAQTSVLRSRLLLLHRSLAVFLFVFFLCHFSQKEQTMNNENSKQDPATRTGNTLRSTEGVDGADDEARPITLAWALAVGMMQEPQERDDFRRGWSAAAGGLPSPGSQTGLMFQGHLVDCARHFPTQEVSNPDALRLDILSVVDEAIQIVNEIQEDNNPRVDDNILNSCLNIRPNRQ